MLDGPFAVGVAAGSAILARSNRYAPDDQRGDFISTVSRVENVPEDHISPWPGSGEPLGRSIAVFCSPTKGLVTADPTYETPGRAAKFLDIPIKQVPLKADYSHDVRAMLAANPNAGVYYIVNPNNPTGTMTPMADIEWLVDNKPAGSIVLVDEAYIHWSDAYPNNSASHLAAAGKDVIILRTFSKIFGMAGARVGYFVARPDIVKKMQMYDGGTLSGQLPMPSLVCATTSLTAHDEIAKRRKELMAARAMTIDFLTKRNLKLDRPQPNQFRDDRLEDPDGQGNASGIQGPGCGDRRRPLADLAHRVAHLDRFTPGHVMLLQRFQQGRIGVRNIRLTDQKASAQAEALCLRGWRRGSGMATSPTKSQAP